MAKVIDPKRIAQVDEGLKFGWGFTSAETVAAWESVKQAVTQGDGDDGKIRIGDFTISEEFTEGTVWINRQSGEGGSFSLKDFEAHIDEFYQKYF